MSFSLFTTTVEQILEDVSLALIETLVNTTLGTSVTLLGQTVVTPPSMVGIYSGAYLLVDTGTDQEQITVSAVTATTFTAYFTLPHDASAPLVGATFPSGQTDHPLFTQNEILGYLADVQNDFLLKTRCIFGVTGTFSEPANLALVAQQRFYAQPPMAIRVERVARVIPGVGSAPKFTELAADLLNGVNANPLNPAIWSQDSAHIFGPLQILNNQCVSANLEVSVGCLELYTGVTLPNDQFVQITLNEFDFLADPDGFICLLMRSNLDTSTCYEIALDGGFVPGQGMVSIQVYVGDAFIAINTYSGPANLTFSRGDVILCAVVGTTIYVYQNGNLIFQVSDSLVTSGQAGIFLGATINVANMGVTNFSTGRVLASSSEIIDLYDTTQADLDMENFAWTSDSDVPRNWFRDQIDTSQLGLDPMPSVNGSLELWYSKRGPLGNQGAILLTGTLLIPDVMAHFLKYGVLARCFSKDGESRDPLRAEYCKKRFEFGITLVQRFLEGIGLDTGAPEQKYSPMTVSKG
jgi:hypothetical protein